MRLIEVVMAAATQLGILKEVEEYTYNQGEVGKQATSDLLHCYHIVERELALDYFPLYDDHETETLQGDVYYATFDFEPARILGVYDQEGNAVEYTLHPTYLKTVGGKVKVEYTYLPEEKDLSDKIECGFGVTKNLLVYGIAAEYAMMHGLLDEAAIWDKKYKEMLQHTYTMSKNKRMPSRRWV